MAKLMSSPKKGPPGDPAATLNEYIENKLTRNLSLVNDGRSFVVDIAYRSEDPALSAKIVNTLMQDYLSQSVENTLAATVAADQSLQKRADELKKDLSDAEQKLEDYSAKAGLVVTPQGTIAATQVNDLSLQLAQARAQKAQADAALATLQTNGAAALESDPAVLASPVIEQLRTQEAIAERNRNTLAAQVGPRHPDLIAANREVAGLRGQIGAEINKIGRSVKSQADAADARVVSLERRQAELQKEGGVQTAQQTVLQTLQDDVTGKRKLYDDFLLTLAQTAKPSDSQIANARVISSAEAPLQPSSPRFGIVALLAAIIGALGATAWVLGYSQLDSGFENLTDVEAATGLPGFASIPHVRGVGRRRLPDQYVLDNPNSPFTEALRALRARVWWATRDRSIKTVLVTSSNPGEGKSSFALSLGRLAAKEGYKVLLLECDFRRPRLDSILKTASVGGGPNFLADPANWRHWVNTDATTGMQYLTASDDNRNIAAMLEAGRLDGILIEAKATYDLVIIDSPPIMKVPDAMLLARSADVVMMMVRWRSTRKKVVQEAIRRLYIDPDKLAGVVLTNVDPRNAEQDMYAGYA
jgi:capsular exopolysaccharide synthesis family protein